MFQFFLQPKQITVELSRRQMTELRALSREWARFDRARQHRKWRPLTAIKDGSDYAYFRQFFVVICNLCCGFAYGKPNEMTTHGIFF